jgi:hypothetical protein
MHRPTDEPDRDKIATRIGCPRAAVRWLVLIGVAVLLAIIPAQLPAQENGADPGSMDAPEMTTPLAVAIFASPNYGVAPLVVGFIPQIHDSSGAPIMSYKWNFGNGKVSTTPPQLTSVIYDRPGVYVTSLTISTADGRSATGFASVTVKAPGG